MVVVHSAQAGQGLCRRPGVSVRAGQEDILGRQTERGANLATEPVYPGNGQAEEVAADDEEACLPVIEIKGPDLEIVEDTFRLPVQIEPESRQVGPERGSDDRLPVPGPEGAYRFSPRTRSRLLSQKSEYLSQKTKLHPQCGAGSEV